jgi:hypothetical protein
MNAVAGRGRWHHLRPQQLPGPRPPFRRPSCSRFTCRSSNRDKSVYHSFDSDEEVDQELTEEFERLADPKRMQRVAAQLDLAWKIGKASARACCAACSAQRRPAAACSAAPSQHPPLPDRRRIAGARCARRAQGRARASANGATRQVGPRARAPGLALLTWCCAAGRAGRRAAPPPLPLCRRLPHPGRQPLLLHQRQLRLPGLQGKGGLTAPRELRPCQSPAAGIMHAAPRLARCCVARMPCRAWSGHEPARVCGGTQAALCCAALPQGYIKCENCRGTGYRAGWLEGGFLP